MKKRLRKKRCVGEFREFFFELTCDLLPGTQEQFLDEFIAEVERMKLCTGGPCEMETSASGYLQMIITGLGRKSPTEDQRQHLLAWLTARPETVDCKAGPLTDMFN